MLIKGITLWQPWASFMAIGLKKNETRSWGTSYRGPLAIHAAANEPKDQIPWDVYALALDHIGSWRSWPRGKILCISELLDCIHDPPIPKDPIEATLGFYGRGRAAWKTKMLQVFEEPIPVKGKQSLWDWEWPEGLRVREIAR